MILSHQSILNRCVQNPPMLFPWFYRTVAFGMSFGLSSAGYDIRLAETLILPQRGFALASSIERFHMPFDVLGVVHDKSTWARKGLAVQNTVIEPGWYGYLTLELSNNSNQSIELVSGMPIAQIIFQLLDNPTIRPYNGKYQDQVQGAQEPIFEMEK